MSRGGAQDRIHVRDGTVRIVRALPDALAACCAASYADDCYEHPYYEFVQRCLSGQFDQYFLILEQRGGTAFVQPVFLVRQSILGGLPESLRAGLGGLLQRWARPLCEVKLLMVGCSTGEGCLAGGSADHPAVVGMLRESLPEVARRLGGSLVVLKDFPVEYRPVLRSLEASGYTRIPSYPACSLALTYRDFDEYMEKALTHQTRKDLRRKFRDAERLGGFSMELVDDLAPIVEEVHTLYRQVLERSAFRFEELTKEYLAGLAGALCGHGRFFVWRDSREKCVAVSICIADGTTLRDCYVCLDYDVALKAHLYFVTFRDVIAWALENGLREYRSGALSYAPKRHLRMSLEPLDLYVLHTSPVLNLFFRLLAPVLEPTRYDPILREFPEYADLR